MSHRRLHAIRTFPGSHQRLPVSRRVGGRGRGRTRGSVFALQCYCAIVIAFGSTGCSSLGLRGYCIWVTHLVAGFAHLFVGFTHLSEKKACVAVSNGGSAALYLVASCTRETEFQIAWASKSIAERTAHKNREGAVSLCVRVCNVSHAYTHTCDV